MPHQVLTIGGISVEFRSDIDASELFQWDAAHQPFLSSPQLPPLETAAAIITIVAGPCPDWEYPELLADGRLWTLRRDPKSNLRRINIHGGPRGLLKMALDITPATAKSPLVGDLYLGPAPAGDAQVLLGYPLMPLLWTILLGRDGIGGGLLCHACGIRTPSGEGLLFSGFSGAGKSTTSRLWKEYCPDAVILSDDRIILRHDLSVPSGFRICGTPWHGEAEEVDTGSAPLSKILILGRSSDGQFSEFVPLPPVSGAAELLARTTPAIWDTCGTTASMALAADVCDSVPVGRWQFAPNAQAVTDLRDG